MEVLCIVWENSLWGITSPSLPRALVSACERRGYNPNPPLSTYLQMLALFTHSLNMEREGPFY